MTTNYNYSEICSHCSDSLEIVSKGYVVCSSCGTIKGKEFVDHKPSLTGNGNKTNSHNSIGKNLDFVGALGSQIGYSSGFLRGARGEKLKAKTVYKYRRLKKFYHDRARLEGNATHLRTMIAYNRIISKLNISKDLKLRSLFLYWKHVNSESRITNHILLIALCLLQSVREAKSRAPIRFAEIIRAFSENGHRVTNKNILRLAHELKIPLSPIRRKSEDYLERIAGQIREDEVIAKRLQNRIYKPGQYELLLVIIATEFLSLITRRERGGVQPYPFAVSVIYLSDRALAKAKQKKPILTQKILAKAADSAEFTIRDHVYRFLGDLYKKYETKLIKKARAHLNYNETENY